MELSLKSAGVYAIEHTQTKRAYIGQAVDVAARWMRHRRDLRNGRHDNKPLQRAWTKYGEDAFTIRLIASFDHVPKSSLDAMLKGAEITIMASRKNLYNVAPGGLGRPEFSDETRARISAERKKMWADPEFRARRAASHAIAMANPDMQKRRVAAIIATKNTPEFKAKQSAIAKAHWEDPEFRAKRAASVDAHWSDPEHRANHSAALKAAWARRKAKP